MVPVTFFSWRQQGARLGSFVVLLTLLSAGLPLTGDTAPLTAPGAGSFGQYLADHQADLAPFFHRYGTELVAAILPTLWAVLGTSILIALLGTWALDVVLGRAFSSLVAPAYARFTRALAYASGRLVLSLSLTVVLGLVVLLALAFLGASLTTLIVVGLFSLAALVLQVVWVAYLYQCSLPNAAWFYLLLLALHSVLMLIVVPLIFARQIHVAVTVYMDNTLVPRLHQEAVELRQSAAAAAEQNGAQAQVATLQARIAQAQAEQQSLQKAIDDRKNSDEYAFAGLVKLRAQGNLTEARAQFEQLLQRFPSGPVSEAAREQVGEIDKALDAQADLKKQQQADAARTSAQARAHLLARAAAGQATLSEMREALLGKTPAEVNALFGAPTDTAADRWGYGQRMIFNPINGARLGLTIVFSDGVVQGVDYYYGTAP